MIEKIAVLGAGTMGHAIAEIFARYGYNVNLFETDEKKRNSVKEEIKKELEIFTEEGITIEEDIYKILDRIKIYSDLKEAVKDRDFVVEAVPENLGLKQEIFCLLDMYCPNHTILASNTSSFKLNDIMKMLSKERKKRTMINHFYNPANIIPITEMSYFGNMPEEIYKEVEQLYIAIGKQPVKVLKDIPGLLANRIQQGVAREVFSLIEMGAAAPEEIDKALEFGPAFRYATTGQLEIADMGGLDLWYSVSDDLLRYIDNSQRANNILKQKVDEGKLGLKSGEGFFKYYGTEGDDIKKRFFRRLIDQLKVSKNY